MRSSDLRLYWRTLRWLDREQVEHQLWRRARRLVPEYVPPLPSEPPAERPHWGPRVARCRGRADRAALRGTFTSWGAERRLDLATPWECAELGNSWAYPVQAFDWAPPLADIARREPDTRAALCMLLERWIAAHPAGRGVAWDPYPTSLRIVAWLDVLHTLGETAPPAGRAQVLGSVFQQAAWLELHLERHLLGTHLLKNARALAVAGRVFAGPEAMRWSRTAGGILERELDRQVNADGAHVEPSIHYHGIALEDVLDLVAFDALPGQRALVARTAAAMLDYLQAVRPPAGGWPLHGDAAVDAEPTPEALLGYAQRLGLPAAPAGEGLRFFPHAGIAVWRDARQYLLADVGPVGPPHLPGHGHCDSLSFEWHVDGLPLVVDAGTRSYERGAARQASRATRAHNTLQLDDREQHEIWAAFRVARRAVVRSRQEAAAAVVAELVPWHDTSLRVVRRFDFEPGRIRIFDRVEGPGLHRITSRLHLHPECTAERDGRTLHLRRGPTRARIVLPEDAPFEVDMSGSVYCASFGVAVPNVEIRADACVMLPWECRLELCADP